MPFPKPLSLSEKQSLFQDLISLTEFYDVNRYAINDTHLLIAIISRFGFIFFQKLELIHLDCCLNVKVSLLFRLPLAKIMEFEHLENVHFFY